MADQHPTGDGRFREKGLADANVRHTTSNVFPRSCQAKGPCEGQPEEPEQAPGPVTGKVNRSDWQTIALWILVAVSFAALVIAGYLIWAKCRFASNF
jgi:hypothetical protein